VLQKKVLNLSISLPLIRRVGRGGITMTLRRSFLATSTARIIPATPSPAFAQKRTTTGVKTGYAPVNSLNLYDEIHGTGEALILLHGGFAVSSCLARTCLCPFTTAFNAR
jgi:hypothetical protein